MSTSPTHPRTVGLVLGAVLLAWGTGTSLAWGQGKTSVRLDSTGNPELRRVAEKSASTAITEINRAAALEDVKRPNLSDAPITGRGRKAILGRWDRTSFYCNRTELARSLTRRAGGTYEIRDVPLLVGDGEEQRSGVLLLNEEGTVIGFRYGSEPATGTIAVASEPSGATVVGTFGDTTATRRAPARFEKVPAGQHTFTVRKEAHPAVDTTLTVAAGQDQSVSVSLKRERVPFRVRSDPAGATVFVNGNRAGTTPLDSALTAGQTYMYRVDEEGYVPSQRRQVVATLDSTLEERVILNPVETGQGPTAQNAPASPEEEEKKEEKIFEVPEEQAELIGGMKALQESVEYPDLAEKARIEGRVIVKFVVNEQGNVVNPKVARGVHELLNREAVEAVEKQNFKPGKQHGEPVKVRMALPVVFRIR